MVASISATLIPCLKSFNHIQELVEQPGYKYEEDVSFVSWADELGRLRVWAANIGAHQTGQSSLEFRLRDASHISQQITKLLKDLDNILNDVKDELSSRPIEASETATSSYTEDTWPSENHTSELQQLYDEVVNIVDCLYKMSMLIRKPAQHDLLIGSHKSDVAAFEPFDREHVRNKYHEADDTTVQRLGRAITQRRKYLKYRDRHHAKLGKGIEGLQGIERTATQSAMSETIATDFKNRNIDFEETSSNSGISQTSYAPSLMDGGSITIPPPPKQSLAGKPFECPYCFFLIEIKGTRSWTRHVFKDIKRYVCTFFDCSTPNRLYESRREWFFHMTTEHHVENLTCLLCKDTLTSPKYLERHVARHLEELALFALPRTEMDDESDEDDLDAGASTSQITDLAPYGPSKIESTRAALEEAKQDVYTGHTTPVYSKALEAELKNILNGSNLGPDSGSSESSDDGDETDDPAAEPIPVKERTYDTCVPCREGKVVCDLEPLNLNSDSPRAPCSRCRREGKECCAGRKSSFGSSSGDEKNEDRTRDGNGDNMPGAISIGEDSHEPNGQPIQQPPQRPVDEAVNNAFDMAGTETSRSASASRSKPDVTKTRTWTDRSGAFKVEAQFIGLKDGKIHLHKLRGVKIAVPVFKMAIEDLEYVEKVTGVSLDETRARRPQRESDEVGDRISDYREQQKARNAALELI